MSFEKLGPTGKLVTGSILDCSRVPFERALRDYDSQLYVRWNPKKRAGYGTWEVRRRPEKKSVVEYYDLGDYAIAKLDYKESTVVNHIFDVSVLNYEILEKLKAIDTWNDKNYVNNLEYNETKRMVEAEDKVRAEAIYQLKHEKNLIRAWKEMILSGYSPAELAKHWK